MHGGELTVQALSLYFPRDVSFLYDIVGKEDEKKMSPTSPLSEPHRDGSSMTSTVSAKV